jgi:hypothetical protein
MQLELTATIPVVQYGNIQPKITLEGDNIEALHAQAMTYLEGVWATHANQPLPKREAGEFVERHTFTGDVILYDDKNHVYKTTDGKVLMSATQYAKTLEKEFDTELISGLSAKKYGIDQDDMKAMWRLNGEVSRSLGTALHKAFENYFLHKDVGTEKEYHMPKHPFLRAAVESFPLLGAEGWSEVIVSDLKRGRVGTVDRIVVLPDSKVCKIIDFKSDGDVTKNLPKHFNQLSWYADILVAHGWTVEGLEVWNYTGEWTCHSSPVLPINLK